MPVIAPIAVIAIGAVAGNSTSKVSVLPDTSPPAVVPTLLTVPTSAIGATMPATGNL